MTFTPTKYDLQLTIDFNEQTFTGRAQIHVSVTDPVKEVDLKISKDLEVERVSFWQAEHVYRGNPHLLGITSNFVVDKEKNSIHCPLVREINAESIKEEGYIEVEYKGKFGGSGEIDGLHHVEGITYEAKSNPDNVITLLPILEDIPVPLRVSVVTPYRAGVETNIPAGEHGSVYNTDLFANRFTTEEESALISGLELRITAPTALVLD
ncbi:unnamed protein product [Caenorhabditis brenneri]